MANKQARPNKPQQIQIAAKKQVIKNFLFLFVGIFIVLVVSGCSVYKLNKSSQSNLKEIVVDLPSKKSTDAFTYLDADRDFEVKKEHFTVFDVMKPNELVANNAECEFGQNIAESKIKKDEQYFEQLLSGYTQSGSGIGTVYSFTYDDESQEGDWRVTVIPNKLRYSDIQQFRNDFDLCFAGGERYPYLISENYLLFVSSCGTGFDDASGLAHGCYEMEQIIKPTITLK